MVTTDFGGELPSLLRLPRLGTTVEKAGKSDSEESSGASEDSALLGDRWRGAQQGPEVDPRRKIFRKKGRGVLMRCTSGLFWGD